MIFCAAPRNGMDLRNAKHNETLRRIFKHPIPTDIPWRDIVALFVYLGYTMEPVAKPPGFCNSTELKAAAGRSRLWRKSLQTSIIPNPARDGGWPGADVHQGFETASMENRGGSKVKFKKEGCPPYFEDSPHPSPQTPLVTIKRIKDHLKRVGVTP